MTREEAMQVLQTKIDNSPLFKDEREAFELAIEALSADATIAVDVAHDIPEYCSWSQTYTNMVQSAMSKAPSADAVEGEWVIEDAHTEHCSVCGYAFHTSALFAVGGNDEPNFCPNCGARMKGGDDE